MSIMPTSGRRMITSEQARTSEIATLVSLARNDTQDMALLGYDLCVIARSEVTKQSQ